MATNTNRLDEIAVRNTRNRVTDVLFATLIAVLMVLCVASLRSAAARPLAGVAPSPTAQTQLANASDVACELPSAC